MSLDVGSETETRLVRTMVIITKDATQEPDPPAYAPSPVQAPAPGASTYAQVVRGQPPRPQPQPQPYHPSHRPAPHHVLPSHYVALYDHRDANSRAKKRFWEAFVVAVCIWALMGMFFGSWADVGVRKGRRY